MQPIVGVSADACASKVELVSGAYCFRGSSGSLNTGNVQWSGAGPLGCLEDWGMSFANL